MDVGQMQIVFSQKLMNDYNLTDPIPSFDIEYYLTEGQRRIYEKYYKLFETDEKARKALNYLVVSIDLERAGNIVSKTGNFPNGEFWKLPVDLAYTLKEECTIDLNAWEDPTTVVNNMLRVYTKPINLDYYSKNVSNPFKKPYSGMVWRLDVSNKDSKIHMLVTGGSYLVHTYHLTYLAYPTDISIISGVNSVLSEIVHQEIVDEAVQIALQVIQVNKQLNIKQ
jgi:hypothetical protein